METKKQNGLVETIRDCEKNIVPKEVPARIIDGNPVDYCPFTQYILDGNFKCRYASNKPAEVLIPHQGSAAESGYMLLCSKRSEAA